MDYIFVKMNHSISMRKNSVKGPENFVWNVIGKCRKQKLSIDCTLDVCQIVKPILLNGYEVLGFGNIVLAEKLHLKFWKHILHLTSSTPKYMVYGEFKRYPSMINGKVCII